MNTHNVLFNGACSLTHLAVPSTHAYIATICFPPKMIYKLLCCAPSKKIGPYDRATKKPGGPPKAKAQMNTGPDAAATINLKRYTEPESIWAALETKHVRLPKMSWLIQHAKNNGILPRRQELPEEAFISVQELKDLYGKGNRDGVLPIIAISFCWDTAAHPDPRGKQLQTVAAMMEKEREKYATAHDSFEGFSEMGVFWDWLSIYQKDQDGKRTPFEQEGFRFALHETMDLWYAHQGTTVYMLTQLPEGSTRKVGYVDSGWTTYERCSAEQIKKFFLFDAQWKLVLDLGAEGDAAKARNWPVGPNDFDAMIDSKIFTNGADKDAVKALFRKMSINQLGGIETLDFDGMSCPSVEDARRLSGCLNFCLNLKRLDLCRVQLSDEAFKVMFSTLSSGALASLKTLNLYGNQIGDTGLSALAKAITPGPSGKGALAPGATVNLLSNSATETGKQAMRDAAKASGLSVYV